VEGVNGLPGEPRLASPPRRSHVIATRSGEIPLAGSFHRPGEPATREEAGQLRRPTNLPVQDPGRQGGCSSRAAMRPVRSGDRGRDAMMSRLPFEKWAGRVAMLAAVAAILAACGGGGSTTGPTSSSSGSGSAVVQGQVLGQPGAAAGETVLTIV